MLSTVLSTTRDDMDDALDRCHGDEALVRFIERSAADLSHVSHFLVQLRSVDTADADLAPPPTAVGAAPDATHPTATGRGGGVGLTAPALSPMGPMGGSGLDRPTAALGDMQRVLEFHPRPTAAAAAAGGAARGSRTGSHAPLVSPSDD